MNSLARIATCNLCQWALDFDLNLRNIVSSIELAKTAGCRFRTGPELEVCGYGCEDHFLEQDTFFHSWESIAKILESDVTRDILSDVGMPILHRGVRYNCRIFLLNKKVLLIRPKMDMADDGNYRESRYFTAWTRMFDLDDFCLPESIFAITGQRYVPFGIGLLTLNDTVVASETCEELFTPQSPHILLALNGAEIIANGSGSHHNLRKLDTRLNLILSATSKSGGVYLYANQQGCDGGRLYFDGSALIAVNGELVAQGAQFSVHDVEVVIASVDLEAVRTYRAANSSRSKQASAAQTLPRIKIDFSLIDGSGFPSMIIKPRLHSVEEEIAFGPACWLWDFLRRSGASGFFLPLSGGADSASTATLVGVMTNLVVRGCMAGDEQVIKDVRRISGEATNSVYTPTDPRELCNRIFHTCYMGTSNSSNETRLRAAGLARDIGSYHLETTIDTVVSSLITLFVTITSFSPKFKMHGGTHQENIALQNIQARLRMVLSYLLAQLLPLTRSRSGYLLVLGSSNVDEALRGYYTKYDCSSADINPIGSICKNDLYKFLRWGAEHMGYTSLFAIANAPASAELEPVTKEHKQISEVDMGLTFEELGIFGKLRKIAHMGPVSIYEKLKNVWDFLSPVSIAEKVKLFFVYYAANRHKTTTLTPSYHAENYSPDDNRFDHRPFLYNVNWPRQFRCIDAMIKKDQEKFLTFPKKAISADHNELFFPVQVTKSAL